MKSISDFTANNPLLKTVFESDEWLEEIHKPWKLLELLQKRMERLNRQISKDALIENGALIRGNVHIGSGSVVSNGAHIYGPVIVGQDCTIGPNSIIRPSSILGDNTVLYPGVEIKNCIVCNGTIVGHFSYLGDSIVGRNCIIGGGVITAVLRFDMKSIRFKAKEKIVDTGRAKLGCFIGNNCRIGIGALVMPGCRIGPNSQIGPGVIVYDNVGRDLMLLCRQDLIQKRVPSTNTAKENNEKLDLQRKSLSGSLSRKKGR